MLKAIYEANINAGLGLWFPSPSEYDANAFLSSLSDNLANVIERKFVLNDSLSNLLGQARRLLIIASGLSVVLIAIAYSVRFWATVLYILSIYVPLYHG